MAGECEDGGGQGARSETLEVVDCGAVGGGDDNDNINDDDDDYDDTNNNHNDDDVNNKNNNNDNHNIIAIITLLEMILKIIITHILSHFAFPAKITRLYRTC